jgi:serine/threonine protein kinase
MVCFSKKNRHDFNVDIWAVGVLTYELSSGLSPFAPRERMHDAAYVDKMTR